MKYASAMQNFLVTEEEIFEKIDQLPRPSGGTDGGIALNETFATLFNSTGMAPNNTKLDWKHFDLQNF